MTALYRATTRPPALPAHTPRPWTQLRVLRVALPVSLLRDMDSVILSGVGGYMTRAEFIVDAIQERVLELTAGEEEDASTPLVRPLAAEMQMSLDPVQSRTTAPVEAADLSATAIPKAPPATILDGTSNVSALTSDVLFGLHNRDYPSLWALAQLANIAHSGPVDIDKFYSDVTKHAWEFGELLIFLERKTGARYTALFPTNRAKQKAAEGRFRSFAIGDIRAEGNAKLNLSGPLFQWRAATVAFIPGEPIRIGITGLGLELLEIVAGITIAEPHASDIARRFFTYLSRHSPGDWKGFAETLTVIGTSGANRQRILDHFASCWPSWTANEVSTNAMGYIARAREWGMIQPKQTHLKYYPTELGLELIGGTR
ncbi:Uncharacterised protein [Mycobacterium xenopi]|uniref:Uncharacterized protein n=4 Tax=Mycobacterium xenopi TaxID=1789 RepID=A0AAD1H342_MYCXE|nr:hypothetical protein MYXE_40940 [Mycobacterium xenopi]SPX90393.1 Uncharacterised protein [Mycobacterium xenopi]